MVPTIYGYILPDLKDHDGYIKIGYTDRKDTETRIREQLHAAAINFKVLFKELQSLALDVKVLTENKDELQLKDLSDAEMEEEEPDTRRHDELEEIDFNEDDFDDDADEEEGGMDSIFEEDEADEDEDFASADLFDEDGLDDLDDLDDEDDADDQADEDDKE